MAAGGYTVPGSPSVYLQMEARNAGDGGDQFPCERFGPGAMCNDERMRVLDIRRTAAAPHPVTLRYNGADRTIRGRTAITVRGHSRSRLPDLAVQRNNCGGGETSMPVRICAESLAERDGDNPDEEDP